MKKIKELSERYGFKIIEDASHAVGATFQNQPVGSCQYSDAVVFSFHPVKIITSGEGGMVTTNDEELASRLEMLRNHGITRDALIDRHSGGWYYEQQSLGLNYRLSDIHAALGHSQLRRLDQFINQRRQLVNAYNIDLKNLPIGLPAENELLESSWHLYAIRIDPDSGISRRHLYDLLVEKNIGVNVHYIPIYRQPFFRQRNINPFDFPGSEMYYESALTIPLHPGLSQPMISRICEEISAAFRRRQDDQC